MTAVQIIKACNSVESRVWSKIRLPAWDMTQAKVDTLPWNWIDFNVSFKVWRFVHTGVVTAVKAKMGWVYFEIRPGAIAPL
jgi:hypothetical protein